MNYKDYTNYTFSAPDEDRVLRISETIHTFVKDGDSLPGVNILIRYGNIPAVGYTASVIETVDIINAMLDCLGVDERITIESKQKAVLV